MHEDYETANGTEAVGVFGKGADVLLPPRLAFALIIIGAFHLLFALLHLVHPPVLPWYLALAWLGAGIVCLSVPRLELRWPVMLFFCLMGLFSGWVLVRTALGLARHGSGSDMAAIRMLLAVVNVVFSAVAAGFIFVAGETDDEAAEDGEASGAGEP